MTFFNDVCVSVLFGMSFTIVFTLAIILQYPPIELPVGNKYPPTLTRWIFTTKNVVIKQFIVILVTASFLYSIGTFKFGFVIGQILVWIGFRQIEKYYLRQKSYTTIV